ncbi:MAG: ribonuclease G [Flavobacteriales endosymbiont of Rhyzopertha dominica]|nr:MAG: ribonuclease E/G [Candidatus Shikimatogenerans bostrichidophilus]
MKKYILINNKSKEILIAILENNRLVEFYKNNKNNIKKILVGDIFIGKVCLYSKGMNAYFIDIGYIKYGFLEYKEYYYNNKLIFKKKKKLEIGEKILVQILKEPINNKGPKLTSKISLISKYLILLPYYKKKILISKKIKNKKEINRLKKILINNINNNLIIIRTLCKNVKNNIIENDIENLKKKWSIIINNIENKIKKIYSEKKFIYTFLRDNINNKYEKIICNNKKIYKKVLEYLYNFKLYIKIKYYNNNNIDIFDKYSVNIQIKTLLGKKVSLRDGSYLIIEKTEALYVIDINSNMLNNINYKNSAFKVNIIAIKEIVRQIRLRNMGGIIIIDCIDMKNKKYKIKIYKYIKKKMKIDKYKHKILPLSKFNIIQITRHKLREVESINNNEKLEIKSKINKKYDSLFYHIKKIENFLNFYYLLKKKKKNIIIYVNVILAAYLKYGFFSFRIKWFLKYKKWINIISKINYKILEYKIIENNKKILLLFKY